MIIEMHLCDNIYNRKYIQKEMPEIDNLICDIFICDKERDSDYYSPKKRYVFIEHEDMLQFPESFLERVNFKPIKVLNHSKLLPNLNEIKTIEACEVLRETLQVHLPGNELIKFTKVKYEEDCCTDIIQEVLDDGWRIIAVIPIQGNRRPDYIFGREK
jgi:hypothetical protein